MPQPRHDQKARAPRDRYGVDSQQFPTPNVEDLIIVWEGAISAKNYAPLDYGTPHSQVSRAKLVFQSAVHGNANEKNVKRIYATTREGQDAYNYALSFESDLGFPSIIRSYVLLREDYDPLPDYDLDPEFTGAVLTKEEMRPVDDGEINSLFVRVSRTYEELPGQWKVSTRRDSELGAVVVRRRYVRTDDANVGVAGAGFQRSFEPRENSAIVSVETEETWGTPPVRKGQDVDPATGVARPYTLQIESFNVGSDPASLGQANKTLTPHGPQQVEVRAEDIAALNTVLFALPAITRPIDVRLVLPDELMAIRGLFNETKGEGSSTATGEGYSSGSNWSFSLSLPARASSSTSIIPDTPLVIRSYDADKVPATEYAFFIAANSTRAQILTKLAGASYANATVNDWPKWQKDPVSLSLYGKQVSVSASASAHQSVAQSDSNSSFSKGTETGFSVETGASMRTVNIQPTLHRQITITQPQKTSTISVTATTGWASGLNFPANGATSAPAAIDAVSKIDPSVIQATDPVAIPVTGLYLSDLRVSDFNSGAVKVFCEVVDMSYFLRKPRNFRYTSIEAPDTEYPALSAITPNVIIPGTGGDPASYAISPALPTGLSMNTTTGTISGTPASTHTLTTYTVTATNAAGTGTTDLQIRIF